MGKLKRKIFDRNEGNIEAAIYAKWIISILYILSAVLLEISMFIIMDLGFAPYYIALDFAIMFILAAVLFVVPDINLQKIMFWVFLLIQMLLVMVNCSLYKYHGDVFSLGILGFAREGAAVFGLYMLELRCFPMFALVAVLDIYMLRFVGQISPRKFPVSRKTLAALLAMFIGFVSFGSAIYTVQRKGFDEESNDTHLYETLMFKNAAMSKFGSFAYYFREMTGEMQNTLSTDKTTKEVVSYLSNYTVPDNSGNQYLSGVGSGVLANDNVFVILTESLEWYMIDPLLTPTLYKLYNGYNFSLDKNGREIGFSKDADKRGIVFENYYSKSKTDFSEANVILGSYPYYDSFSTHFNLMKPYSVNADVTKKDFGFSMPNMLKKHTGIEEARYLHTYLSSFYGRPEIFPVFGFDELMFIEDLGVPYNIPIGNPILDSDAMDVELEDGRKLVEYLLPTDKSFYTFYATISTHGPYTYYETLDKYYREINRLAGEGKLSDDLLEDPTAVNAMAKAMDFDNCIAKIVAHMQETGLIDTTTLLLFSDHQAYYQGIDVNYKKLTNNFESSFDPERYRIPGLIYSTKLPYYSVDKFFNYFDYTPTMYDLMGVPYNPNIYLGHSLFEEEASPCIISRTGGVFNDKIFTMDGTILKYKKDGITDKNVQDFTKGVNKLIEKWDYIDYMYYYNLFGEIKVP